MGEQTMSDDEIVQTSLEAAKAAADRGGLAIDGLWTPETTKALQTYFGISATGLVTDQPVDYKADNPGLSARTWVWRNNPKTGAEVMSMLQEKVGAEVTGLYGPDTCRCLYNFLGLDPKESFDKPDPAIKEMQKRLDEGSF